MVVRRRLTGLAGSSSRRFAKRIGKLWTEGPPISPDIARLGEVLIILGKKLRFKGLFIVDLDKKIPPLIHFMVGDRRMLCINRQSERFVLDPSIQDQRNAAAEMLKRSVTVLKEKGYARELVQARKRELYKYVFDPIHSLYAIAEPEVDHDAIAESFEALKRLKIIDESIPAQYERGEFKADQDLIV